MIKNLTKTSRVRHHLIWPKKHSNGVIQSPGNLIHDERRTNNTKTWRVPKISVMDLEETHLKIAKTTNITTELLTYLTLSMEKHIVRWMSLLLTVLQKRYLDRFNIDMKDFSRSFVTWDKVSHPAIPELQQHIKQWTETGWLDPEKTKSVSSDGTIKQEYLVFR